MPGSKPGPKRTPRQREADLELIARWALEGLSGLEITARLNTLRNRPDDGFGYTLTPQQVSLDLRRIEQRWQAAQIEHFDAARTRQLAELAHIKRTAWAEYWRSRETAETTVTEQIVAAASAVAGTTPPAPAGRQRAQIRKEGRLGDPRYLDTVLKCIEREAKLRGLDAAVSVDLMVRHEAELIAAELGLSVDEVMREANAIITRAQEQQQQ